MKSSTDTQAIKLQVSQGRIWYLDRDFEYPRNSGMSPEAFLASELIAPDAFIRTVGSPVNVSLIMRLYDLKQKGRIGKVEVCSPLVCRVAKHRRDPEAVLMAMRRFSRAASLGGFHEVGEHDYRSYALANALHQGAQEGQPVNSHVLGLLRAHPAWRPLSFITSLNQVATAGLLGYILDPRWYVDECSPDSIGKLYEWLGLTPRTQAGVSGNRSPGRHHKRCQLVLQCWKNSQLELAIRDRFELCLPQPVNDCDLPGWAPSDIIWRQWGQKLKLGVPDAKPGDPVMADLRASQRFIAFLRLTWISEIYRDSPATPDDGAPLFRPSDFFKNELESAAYEQHQLENGMI